MRRRTGWRRRSALVTGPSLTISSVITFASMRQVDEDAKSGGRAGAVVLLAVVAVATVVVNVVMRCRGYSIPGRTVVRCSEGHLFRTTWIEGGSLKAVRLTPRTRFQRCPVGHHWVLIHPVKDADLTDEDRLAVHG